jgi:hypothetical protein
MAFGGVFVFRIWGLLKAANDRDQQDLELDDQAGLHVRFCFHDSLPPYENRSTAMLTSKRIGRITAIPAFTFVFVFMTPSGEALRNHHAPRAHARKAAPRKNEAVCGDDGAGLPELASPGSGPLPETETAPERLASSFP